MASQIKLPTTEEIFYLETYYPFLKLYNDKRVLKITKS